MFECLDVHNIEVNTRSQDSDVIRFKINTPRLESTRHYFTYRLPALWNVIPNDVLDIELSDSGSNNCFKKHLKLWLKEKLNTFDHDVMSTWLIKCKCASCRLA